MGYKTYQNVLQLWEGSYLSRTAQSFYDWGVIAQHFEAMRLLGELQDTMKPLPSIDGQLSLMTAGAEERKPSAFTFSQEIIDAVLTRGSGISEGKMRIYEQFQKSLSAKENADFLKNEYGWGGAYPAIVGADIDEQHDGKGIRISKGIGSDKPHIDLKWSQVEKRIAELIKLDRYLNPKEKAQYPEWLQRQEERRAALAEERRNREILSTAPSEKAEAKNEQYEYHLGSTVYLGANEYEILSFDDERVMLYDTQFPLFNKEMTRTEFDSKVQENPLNDHLKVVEKHREEKAVEFDIGMGYLGNGLTVWNRAVEVNGDYQNIAHISPEGEITFYVFGLDMMTIKVPEKLEPLLSMVAGGDISGITAWDLLLQLAERVSSKTEVTVKFQFDQNVAVDISNLTVSNDYFRLTSASLDENNLLTVKCNFIKQSQAIDPDTANPICILSGVQLSAKNGAQWDADQCLSIENSGSVGYDIYLGANALYNMAKQTSFQEQYGIYPYEEPENTTHPCGGHFYCESYQEFTDRFILDNGSWSGWKTVNGTSYYFVENNALKGIHKVPGLNDESNEYFYQFNETTGACEGKVTGLIEFDGAWYYAINGVAKSGWWNLTDANGNNGYYYFDPETFQGLDGENSSFFPNVTYQFENGKLVKGAWLATDHGKRYYYGPGFVQGKWYTIEGNLYFFNQDGYRYEGLRYVKLRDNHDDPIYWYDFGEDGICHGVYQHTGLFYLNGNTYYTINGMVCNGLYLAEDGYYYYFGSVDYTAVKNTRHWVSYPNDTGFAPAFYSFDEDGRMIIDTPDPSKDGIVNEDGELYYYVNGVRFYAGLIQIDGDYYYVNSSCKVVTNQRYWVSKTNDLLPAGFYNFDVDGKMTDAPIPTPDPDPDPNPDPEVKNGIVSEDGELYYYVNGVKIYAGLIQIDGNYYYVNSYCKVITSQRYWVSKTNNLLPATFYTFGADGKMVR